MFIFVLQTIWLYIGELAGKDLDVEIILKFLLYFSPKLVPLVLPLSILLTSIMTFGSFAENYEFAAMKSSGISLQRAMSGLTIFVFLVSLTAFFFSNNVIPAAEFKSINLRKNIAKLKPAMAISENIFNEVGNINIKVEEKSGDNDQFLRDIIIHKKNQRSGNFTVMKATEGELMGSTDSDVLSLVLKDGNYYDEIQPNDAAKRKNKPYAKSYFEEYIINIDLSEFNNVDLDDENYHNSQGMLNTSELRESIDSFSTNYNKEVKIFKESMLSRSGAATLELNYKPADTITETEASVLDLFNAQQASQITGFAISSAEAALSHIKLKKQDFKISFRQINKYEIALHEKYALAAACFVLFFVGAPLGAIIRKGGMGLPMVIAILLFLTYHFIGIFAKNSAEDGSISPFFATWLPTIIMLPLGILLTYRATTDQGLFAFDSIFEPFKKLLKKAGLIKKKDKID
ncbi:LptF/LptG family permease [Autumnicola patrickiae]